MPRTTSEKHAIDVAMKNNIPVMGLCGGFQKALHNYGVCFEHLATEISPKLNMPLPYPLHVGPEIATYDRLGGRVIARTKSTIYDAPLLQFATPTQLTDEARHFLGEGVESLTSWSEHKWGTTEQDIQTAVANSRDPLAKQIKILAKSPDGIVDAVGIPDKLLAVQRHPEMGQDKNDYRFFKWITDQAKARAGTKQGEAPKLEEAISVHVGEGYDDSRNFVRDAIAPMESRRSEIAKTRGQDFVNQPHAATPLNEWLQQYKAAGRGAT